MKGMGLSTTRNNVENGQNNENYSEQLIEVVTIEGVPVKIQGNNEVGFFAFYGDFCVSSKYESTEEVREKILAKDWEILLNCMVVIAHSVYGLGVKEIMADINKQQNKTGL